jgi:hypothetical protein
MIDSWARVTLIFCVIVVNGVLESALEELRILPAEFMMLVRWTRDVIRYDLRWMVQEKATLLLRGRPGSPKR